MDGAQAPLLRGDGANNEQIPDAAVVNEQGQAPAAAGVHANAGAPADAAVHVEGVNVAPAARFGLNSPGVKMFLLLGAIVAGGGVVSSVAIAAACALHAMSADSPIQSMPGIGLCHATSAAAPASPSSSPSMTMTRTASQWPTNSASASNTGSQAATNPLSATSSASPSNTGSHSLTSSQSPSLSLTGTSSPSQSATASQTGTPSPTGTLSPGFGVGVNCFIQATELGCIDSILKDCSQLWQGSVDNQSTSVHLAFTSGGFNANFNSPEFCSGGTQCDFPPTSNTTELEAMVEGVGVCLTANGEVVIGSSSVGAPVNIKSTILPFAGRQLSADASHFHVRGGAMVQEVADEQRPEFEGP